MKITVKRIGNVDLCGEGVVETMSLLQGAAPGKRALHVNDHLLYALLACYSKDASGKYMRMVYDALCISTMHVPTTRQSQALEAALALLRLGSHGAFRRLMNDPDAERDAEGRLRLYATHLKDTIHQLPPAVYIEGREVGATRSLDRASVVTTSPCAFHGVERLGIKEVNINMQEDCKIVRCFIQLDEGAKLWGGAGGANIHDSHIHTTQEDFEKIVAHKVSFSGCMIRNGAYNGCHFNNCILTGNIRLLKCTAEGSILPDTYMMNDGKIVRRKAE